ncbi:hypothetical protein FGG08_004570 [Glutinoglossum americanum]|uniref:Uncharacterized protein n=1 Tax=Glutinoglossum americanum TaxID=1670608 RepID=A0A9P8I786_9PEZI|nr:hypothetical protein FGG08_004570 [Glutinoglossum americanum]
MASFTKTIHKEPYPAISSSLPSLSQATKTVLITGGSTGIGYAIARAFAFASASEIIILGRRADFVSSAASRLTAEMPEFKGKIVGRSCDISDSSSAAVLWSDLEKEGVVVDVLVLNAARTGKPGPILQVGQDEVWADYVMNVRANLDFVERFSKQNERAPNGKKKSIINVSTMAIHDFVVAGDRPNYTATKNAGTLLLQQIAKDMPVEKIQIISFHPGWILTEAARKGGYDEKSAPWDDENLPGHFAVWAASPDAAFLHGRFVWACWDVDELRTGEIRKRIDADPDYLKIGVKGL